MGCLATAAPVGSDLHVFHTHARFRVVSRVDTRDDATQWCESVDVLPDEVEDGSAVLLQADVLQLVEQLRELRGAPRTIEQLDQQKTPSAFSFALASALELDCVEAQSLLECDSSVTRLERQKLLLESSVSFAAAQKALQSLGGLGL